MKRYRLVAGLLFVFVTVMPSCKKKNDDNNLANVRLSAIDFSHGGTTVHYRLVYEVAGNMDSIVMSGTSNGYRKFDYIGSSYTITDENSNTITVQASTDGRMLAILGTDSTVMKYNGSQLGEQDVYTKLLTYPFISKAVTIYAWSNGDVSNVTLPGNLSETYGYDQNRSGQAGDAIRVEQILAYGRSNIKTGHLPMSLTYNGAQIEQYLYEFDGQSRITKLTKVQNNTNGAANDTLVYRYSY